MTDVELEKRIQALILAASTVQKMFRNGYHPTEAQFNALDGAIMALDALKTCGHVIREDCMCDEVEVSRPEAAERAFRR